VGQEYAPIQYTIHEAQLQTIPGFLIYKKGMNCSMPFLGSLYVKLDLYSCVFTHNHILSHFAGNLLHHILDGLFWIPDIWLL